MRAKIIALLFIIALGLILRLHLLLNGYIGFAQPDNYIYYSVAQYALTHHWVLGSNLSGFPNHNFYTEKPLLIYQIFLLYPITHSIYASMLILPLLYSVLLLIFLYLFAEELGVGTNLSLLASFLGAVVVASLNVTSAMQYRGGSFVPILLLVAIYFLAKINSNKGRVQAYYMLISAMLLAIMLFLWNGALYVVPIYLIGALLMLFGANKLHGHTAISLTIIILLAGIILVLSPVGIKYLGSITPIDSYTATIAELQAPTLNTYLVDFGLLPLIALIGIVVLWFKKQITAAEIGLLVMFMGTFPLALLAQRWASLFYIPLILMSVYGLAAISRKPQFKAIYILIILAVALSSSLLAVAYFVQLAPDTSARVGAYISWIDANTPQNATFLTLWQDGSIIEGWANRQSYTDSVIGQNSTRIYQFSHFLFAKAWNLTYLTQVRPDYLVIHHYWLNYTAGIAMEGNLPPNININGTNFEALENGSIDLPIVYKSANTIIYKIYT
ncbi:MAG: hypothetical protein QXS81_01440 [Candidatus Micrarchaeaceae archaeon]